MVATENAVSADLALLSDEQVATFIINGYLLLRPRFRRGLNELVCDQLAVDGGSSTVNFDNDPDHTLIFKRAPALREVFDHPEVDGAIVSLLGRNYETYERFCHAIKPGQGRAYWHVDDVNLRHHIPRRIQVFYYPHDVTPNMGATLLVPGTHFRFVTTECLQTYGNIRSQVAMAVPAGTVAILNYDIWHTPTRNTSNRTRYMVHLYCRRTSEPTAPTWNHDPASEGKVLTRFHGEWAGHCGQTEHKRVRQLRLEMWQYLQGKPRLSQMHPEGVQGYLNCLAP